MPQAYEGGVPAPLEHIVAGWVLIIPTLTPRALGKRLPASILTISDCIMVDLPRPEFWDWYLERSTAELNRESGAPESHVITVAMHPVDAADFLAVEEGEGEQAGYFDLLRSSHALPDDCQVLGYEVVGAEDLLDFHSWHCHSFADEVVKALGITVNDHGLLQTRDEGLAVRDWMIELPSTKAPASVYWTVVALAAGRDDASAL